MKLSRIALLSLFAMIVLASCKKDNDDDMGPDTSEMTKELKLSFDGLENLGANYSYEGWIMVDGSPLSTGTFMVDDNGSLSKSVFDIAEEDLNSATAFILTIEPYPDNDASPSDVHVLAGDFSSSSADLSVEHGAALGNDFMNAIGNYILATPTSSSMDDELSGLWFLNLSSGAPAVGLELPALPAGWVYEGWAVKDGVPVSTGRFSMADMADDAAPHSATDAGSPPFPGEDFIMNAPSGLSFPTELNGGLAVISIEPQPDNSPHPFALKPLVGEIPANAMDHNTYMMNNNSGSFLSGMATR